MDPPIARHAAFEIDRAWCDDVTAALADAAAGDAGRLVVVLARWWTRREARLAAVTTRLDDAVRAELRAAFAGDDLFAELAWTAPAVVRRDALGRLRRAGPRLARLAATDAPMIVLDRERETCARLLDELDPAARREDEPPPAFGTVPDVAGVDVVDLHAWLEHMLIAAQADAPDVGLGEAFAGAPEVVALPHPIVLPGGLRPGDAGGVCGPITYAIAGDDPDPALAPALDARVRELAWGRALVSFVWRATDASGPWRPIG